MHRCPEVWSPTEWYVCGKEITSDLGKNIKEAQERTRIQTLAARGKCQSLRGRCHCEKDGMTPRAVQSPPEELK